MQAQTYELVRMDNSAAIERIKFDDGQTVRFSYDYLGRVKHIVDTLSDTIITEIADETWAIQSQGWVMNVQFRGTVRVDQATGCVITTLENGTVIKVDPNGCSSVTDASGSMVAIHEPAVRKRQQMKKRGAHSWLTKITIRHFLFDKHYMYCL